MENERWLIKSSGRILGPFTIEELTQLIRARSLSIIDEVRDPQTRWNFLREHVLLAEVVRQLRDELDNAPDATQVTFVGSRGATGSLTETPPPENDQTWTPGRNRATDHPARPIEATEKNVPPQVTLSGASPFKRSKEKNSAKMRWPLLIVVSAFLALGFLLFREKSRRVQENQSRQFLDLGKEQVRYGNYAKAFSYFKKAHEVVNLSADELLTYVQLQAIADGDGTVSTDVLARLAPSSEARAVRDVSITKSLVLMRNQKWSEAASELGTVLTLNPTDEEALMNLAEAQYFQGFTGPAAQTIETLVSHGYRSSDLLILKSWLALTWPEAQAKNEKIRLAQEELKKDLQHSFELHFEKSLILAWLYQQRGQIAEAQSVVNSMWTADPLDSRNFLQPLAVDHQILSWEKWGSLCDSVQNHLRDGEVKLALIASCFYLKGNTFEGMESIDRSRKQYSQSTLLAGLHARLLVAVGREGEAKGLVHLAQNEPLAQLSLGLACAKEKDWTCAAEAWQKVLAVTPENPMAMAGEITALKARGSENASQEQLRRAMAMAPRYRPLLELRGEVNGF